MEWNANTEHIVKNSTCDWNPRRMGRGAAEAIYEETAAGVFPTQAKYIKSLIQES